jgi:hypothetical protein
VKQERIENSSDASVSSSEDEADDLDLVTGNFTSVLAVRRMSKEWMSEWVVGWLDEWMDGRVVVYLFLEIAFKKSKNDGSNHAS